jgi:predicted transcriptional regulator
MFVSALLQMARENLVTAAEGADLIEIAREFTSECDVVVVTNAEGDLKGVVTKTDIVRQISVCEGATCMCLASAAMTRHVVLCRSDDLLHELAELMKKRHLKNIPVVLPIMEP